MININNKSWDKLCVDDIKTLLDDLEGENFFFEFKSDKVSPKKIVKEISAFANTYGGYILLGVEDDKTITGCSGWTEHKIATTIHDSLSPTPMFELKSFDLDGKTIVVIKVEEGQMPPYITSGGEIVERISSSSCPVNTSEKVTQMYYKREEELKKRTDRISIEDIKKENIPTNMFGYIDIGFHLTTSSPTPLYENFYNFDFSDVTDLLKTITGSYSISRVGYSYVISFNSAHYTGDQKNKPVESGLHDFMEIMADGSVKCRVLLLGDTESSLADVNQTFLVSIRFKRVYEQIMGEHFADIFISAQKFQKLTVFKQFTPFYPCEKGDEKYNSYYLKHCEKYGNNLIITSNRIPRNGLLTIERKTFDELGEEYNTSNLYKELFMTAYANLGFIDDLVE